MKKQVKKPILMSIAILAIIFLQFVLVFTIADQISKQKQENTWNTKLIYACYNNNIRPCDDATVSAWNKQNPDKAITESYLRQDF